MDGYEEEKFKVKLHAVMICTCCCCFGMILGVGAFFAYSNNLHCDIGFLSCNQDKLTNQSYNHSYNHSYIEYINGTNLTSNYSYVYDGMNNTFNTSNSTYDYGQVLDNKTEIDLVNKSVMLYSKSVIRDDIEKIQEINAGRGIDDGAAIAISISSVFVFIGCLLSCGWYVKYKPNPIKNIVTSRTASKIVKMTKEEIEISQINPILKAFDNDNKSLFMKAIKNITEATKKDNAHDFTEAIKLYQLGIDQLMVCMKTTVNANDRFQMAKKMDLYVQRVIYLKKIVANRSLLDVQRKAPAHPLIEKKCVCNANVL
jgi:hypothetical protein